MRSAQQGVALITAMLIMAIIATLATTLALGQQVWLRQTQNLTDLAQAESLRHGAYEAAAALLVLDAKNSQTNKSDNLQEPWAQRLPPLPVEGGVVAISIADAQARFNLNNLIAQPPQNQTPADELRIFTDILKKVDLSTDLINPLLDWLDSDFNTLPGGAEDLDYLSRDPPYRAANRPLRSFDELRLIKNYTQEVLDKLEPYVVVLPPGPNQSPNRKPINVNTASADVLSVLIGGDSSVVTEARKRAPFESPSDFSKLFSGKPLFVAGTYNVKSEYFIVTVIARIGRIERRTEALIERSSGGNAKADILWYRQPTIRRVQFALDEDKN